MKRSRHHRSRKRKRRIERRLEPRDWPAQDEPMFRASNVHYDVADRTRAMAYGGIGVIHQMCRQIGLIDAIDERLHLLQKHLPYSESDHVLNIGFNALCGGSCLEDLELLRNDEAYMDALGTQRIPDPTTAGDFCRRFERNDVIDLMESVNQARLKVWREQPEEFFEEAVIEADGTIVETTGDCKEGMDISYNGRWGYHPMIVSLATRRRCCSSRTGRRIDPRTRVGLSGSTRRSICAARPASARSGWVATRRSPRPSTWTVGMKTE